MNRVFGGAIVTAAVLAAATAGAESPLSPMRPLSSQPPGKQWVEPPAATGGKTELEPKPVEPDNKAARAPEASAPAAAAAVATPADEPDKARKARSTKRAARKSGRTRTAAGRLNRRELSRIHSGVPSTAYYPSYGYRFGPNPNGDSGN